MPRQRMVTKKRLRGGERLSRVGRDVVSGLKEAVAHAQGEINLPTREYEVPGPVDVKAIRSKLGLSQSEFSRRYGFSVRTLQDWKSGVRNLRARRAPT